MRARSARSSEVSGAGVAGADAAFVLSSFAPGTGCCVPQATVRQAQATKTREWRMAWTECGCRKAKHRHRQWLSASRVAYLAPRVRQRRPPWGETQAH